MSNFEVSGNIISDTGHFSTLTVDSSVRLFDSSNHAITLSAPHDAPVTPYTLHLPTTSGTNGYFLQTDGISNTSWVAGAGGNATLLDNSNWSSPAPIGVVTPNSAVFTSLTVSGQTNLNGSTGNPIHGTNTNDGAGAGYVGEYVEGIVVSGGPGAPSFTTNTAANIISISLTAGDWDVWGIANFAPNTTTSVTRLASQISTTSATMDSPDTNGRIFNKYMNATVFGIVILSQAPQMLRISLAATTTVYLVGIATFTASTMSGFGSIRARRVR